MELAVNALTGVASWNDRACLGLVRRPLCKIGEPRVACIAALLLVIEMGGTRSWAQQTAVPCLR